MDENKSINYRSIERGRNMKRSENARKAKLEFLGANPSNNYTTIWDSITIEESVRDGENTYVKERIPVNIFEQRPSTTDLNASGATDSSNGQFPSSTKSLSPKNLNKASIFSDSYFGSTLNRTENNSFEIDNHFDDQLGCHLRDDRARAYSRSNSRNESIDKQINDNRDDLDYYLLNDFDKFKNNKSLSQTELQLAKWKEIKRFKDQFKQKTHLPDRQDNHFDTSFDKTQDKSFDEQQSLERPFYERDLNDPNWSSSPDQSFDYYASVDDTNTRLSDLEKDIDEKSDDHLVNFDENQFEYQPEQLKYESDQQTIDNFTPRTSFTSELNEHDFIDGKQLDQVNNNVDQSPIHQLNNLPYQLARTNESPNSPVHPQSNSTANEPPTKTDLECNFDNLNHLKIEKFFNNLNTPSPLENRFQESSNSNALEFENQSLLNRKSGELYQESIRIPGEVLKEPLIKSRTKRNLDRIVKRRSVIVQTSRPVSLMSVGDDEVKHLLTIVKNDQLKQCVPVKDVYVINRTVYQIQKLSSFILEYRYLQNRIQTNLHQQLFPNTKMEDLENSDQHSPAAATNKSTIDTESKWSHIKLIIKWIIVHLFSTPGLCFVLIVYCLMGAFIFEELERENNLLEIRKMNIYRNETVYDLFELNSRNLNKREWIRQVNEHLKTYEQVVIDKVEMNGYSGNATDKWNYSDSFLFSVTVISTIGYGKLSPKTMMGQLTTIIYACLGIPIMLLFITNLGTLMASLFRVSYDTICCYLCNLRKEDQPQSNENQNNQNTPFTVPEQLTDPKLKPVETNETSQKQPNQLQPDESDSSPNSQDQNFETDSIVVFQNNEYRTNVKDNKLVLTYDSDPILRNRVPIRIVVLIVSCYICLGGLLFSIWESDSKDEKTGNDFFKWSYFCFITLSTIGFGDLVPGDSIKLTKDFEGTAQILFCCIYLIFGLALIAMSFSLIQEEVIIRLKKLYESLGMDVPRRTLNY